MPTNARVMARRLDMRRRLAFVGIVAIIGVTACKPLTRPAQPGSWTERKAELQLPSRWRFEGRVAIAGVENGGSAGIRWKQADTRSDVAVFGALGIGGLTIELVGDRLHVETSRGEAVDDDAAARVIAERLGVPLPLTELRYWLLGVTAPGSDSTEVLGENQRLSALTQQGWEVHFAEYQAVAGDLLPARVDVTRDRVRVRLRITRWQWR